jgi:uracil-DNA glycosylase
MQHSSTYEALPHDWALALERKGFGDQEILELRAAAYDPAATQVLPLETNLFRAFYATPLDKVRIVVVGKDPYPELKDASGVAFSTPKKRKPPLALRNIFTNLEDDKEITFTRPKTGDLTRWTDEGALLLNAALTLTPGPPSPRFTLWKPFLKAVLSVMSDQQRPIPIILLGGEANNLSNAVRDKKAIIRAGHPTPRSDLATRFTLFRDAKPFSEANVFLKDRGQKPFDWRLPASTPTPPRVHSAKVS